MSIIFDSATKVYSRIDTGLVGVKDLNLSIEKNEFVCLVGPSGCGKSTAINQSLLLIQTWSRELLPQQEKVVWTSPKT